MRVIAILAGALVLAGCGDSATSNPVDGMTSLERHAQNHRVGSDPDQWIEIKSHLTGEWDRVGLIFGFLGGDYDECTKAIDGLKRANPVREYRCVPAN